MFLKGKEDRVITGTDDEIHALRFVVDMGGYFEADKKLFRYDDDESSELYPPGRRTQALFGIRNRPSEVTVLPRGQHSAKSRDGDTLPTFQVGIANSHIANVIVDHVVTTTAAFR